MKLLTSADTRLASLLDHRADEVRIDPSRWSWSGAHGGLAVAPAPASMQRALGEDVALPSITPSSWPRSTATQLCLVLS